MKTGEIIFSGEAEAAYRKSYGAVVLCVKHKYPSMGEYAEDIVSDAFFETIRKYPEHSTAHLINIWRLKSINRSVNFMKKRKYLIRLSNINKASAHLADGE